MRDFNWSGRTVFILAGGPSVLDLDLSPLRGRPVIAINSAYETWPDADVCFFADARWYGQVYVRRPAYAGQFVTTAAGAPASALRFTKIDPSNGIATKPDQLALSRTSVSGAANLARHWGASVIVLLGVDGKTGDTRHHHGAAYPWPLVHGCFDTHRNELAAIAPSLRAEGIRLANCSPVNIISGWQNMTFADLFPRKSKRRSRRLRAKFIGDQAQRLKDDPSWSEHSRICPRCKGDGIDHVRGDPTNHCGHIWQNGVDTGNPVCRECGAYGTVPR